MQNDPPSRTGRCGKGPQREAAFLAIADLRFAAWFLWMTPLEAALSSFCAAWRSSASAGSLSPGSAASRNLRTADFSALLTALLRSCRFSFCLFRLIWDLMFATTCAFVVGRWCRERSGGACGVHTAGHAT